MGPLWRIAQDSFDFLLAFDSPTAILMQQSSTEDSLTRQNQEQFATPILIIFWRRKDTVLRVIDVLRGLRPANIYLASDGPRDGNIEENSKVHLVRKLVEDAIDWPCAVHKRYSDINQGIKYGPFNAMDWFFSSVEEGIILEDDVLPARSFFFFCRELLERYRDDTRIWQISGNNLVQAQNALASDEQVWMPLDDHSSYLFSRDCLIWGWATWRRCWRLYDLHMSSWPDLRDRGIFANVFQSPEELKYWSCVWHSIFAFDIPLTWDYQWIYACTCNGALSIVPKVNLISNLGFGLEGINCSDADDPLSNLPVTELHGPIVHPAYVLQDRSYDRAMFERFRWTPQAEKQSFSYRLWFRVIYTLKGMFTKLKRSSP